MQENIKSTSFKLKRVYLDEIQDDAKTFIIDEGRGNKESCC